MGRIPLFPGWLSHHTMTDRFGLKLFCRPLEWDVNQGWKFSPHPPKISPFHYLTWALIAYFTERWQTSFNTLITLLCHIKESHACCTFPTKKQTSPDSGTDTAGMQISIGLPLVTLWNRPLARLATWRAYTSCSLISPLAAPWRSSSLGRPASSSS